MRLLVEPWHEMTEVYTYKAEVGSNWKLFIDAFAEFYHAPVLHQKQAVKDEADKLLNVGFEALHYDLAWGDFDSGEYVMLHLAQARPGQRTTGAQIGITVDDVDAVHDKAPAFGVTVLQPPHDAQWGRNAVYEDPDRNIVSVTSG